jgi:hypothetical protein
MQNPVVIGFWLALAVLFGVMAWKTHKTRSVTLPRAILLAKQEEDFKGQDVGKLEPVFKDMLAVEVGAFALTLMAAIVTAVTYLYGF